MNLRALRPLALGLIAAISAGCAGLPPINSTALPGGACPPDTKGTAIGFAKEDLVVGLWEDASHLLLLAFAPDTQKDNIGATDVASDGWIVDTVSGRSAELTGAYLPAHLKWYNANRHIIPADSTSKLRQARRTFISTYVLGWANFALAVPGQPDSLVELMAGSMMGSIPTVSVFLNEQPQANAMPVMHAGSLTAQYSRLFFSPDRKTMLYDGMIVSLSDPKANPAYYALANTCNNAYNLIPNPSWTKAALLFRDNQGLRVQVSDFMAEKGFHPPAP